MTTLRLKCYLYPQMDERLEVSLRKALHSASAVGTPLATVELVPVDEPDGLVWTILGITTMPSLEHPRFTEHPLLTLSCASETNVKSDALYIATSVAEELGCSFFRGPQRWWNHQEASNLEYSVLVRSTTRGMPPRLCSHSTVAPTPRQALQEALAACGPFSERASVAATILFDNETLNVEIQSPPRDAETALGMPLDTTLLKNRMTLGELARLARHSSDSVGAVSWMKDHFRLGIDQCVTLLDLLEGNVVHADLEAIVHRRTSHDE